MRPSWPGDRPNDFEFLFYGKPAGRCYRVRNADNREVWRWTLYGFSSGGGMEHTLQEAQKRFKETYEAALTKKAS